MNSIQTALTVVGVLALLEAVWGLASPKSIKRIAGWYLQVSRAKHRPVGIFLFAAALLLLVIVLAGQPLSAWLLIFMALVFAAFGIVCFRENAVHRLLKSWIMNRTEPFIRFLYGLELVLGAFLLWVALTGR